MPIEDLSGGRLPKKWLIILAVLAGILILFTYPEVYMIKGSSGGTLFWNAHEALLFKGVGRDGAHMSYGRYALEPFLESMGDAHSTDNSNCAESFAIRITNNEVQRHDTDVGCASYDVFKGEIYADQWPKLSKWVGTRFERPTPEEYGAFATFKFSKKISQHPWEFDNVDGWSMRGGGHLGNEQYSFTLDGQPMTVVSVAETFTPAPLSVQLLRPGQPAQTIWSFDGRLHRVSKAEYKKTFEER